ncbi:MAG: hypothetical protein K2X91_12305 [Thermoleophilia bacterium]|nr:hypothetical protein [Thermoleophilia bacterium]
MSEPLDVVVHVNIAFDLGYEIDLEAARPLMKGVRGVLPRRRRTPESIRYRPAPLRVPIEPTVVRLPAESQAVRPSSGQLSVFDFGAASLALRFDLRATPEELLGLAGELADLSPLMAQARELIGPWVERLKPAVHGFEVSDLSEEFILFQVPGARASWLEDRAAWIAGLVRLESEPLSPGEVAEATRLSLSYTPDDLVTLDWAAGFLADRDCDDTLQVLEFANVQLLEFRHIDDRLDDRLEAAYRLMRPLERPARRGFFGRSHDDALRNVRELEIEATSLFERADNALKLIGDQYLSRVYDLASARFHLPEWQQSIRRKLDTVGDVYDLLVQQSGGRRMEFLEIVVVVLIATEILLALVRH